MLRVIDGYYVSETDGYKETTPVIHLFGRDEQYRRHHVRVDDFKPYFCVRQSEWLDLAETLGTDDRVLDVVTEDLRGRDETAIDGEPLVRVLCREPSDVKDLREMVDDPFEADVLFPVRFLLDVADSQWLCVPDDVEQRNGPLSVDDIEKDPYDQSQLPDRTPPPRICTYDLEVLQSSNGPPVVSTEGTERADNPITAITAHDSYTGEYVTWLLLNGEWEPEDVEAIRSVPEDTSVPLEINIFENPNDVVGQFCEWVIERGMDAMLGWNAAGFDHPYLVNYGLSNGVGAVKRLSPTRDVYPMDGDGSFINSSLKGRLLLDLMVLYDKTTVNELDSYRLSNVAESEGVSVGKLDIDEVVEAPDDTPSIDWAWENDPVTFLKYSLRDVQACVAINNESKENVNIL